MCVWGAAGTPPLPFPVFLLATRLRVLKMVLSCLYLSVQRWTSHLFIDAKFAFPFSCASLGTGKHVSGSRCYWQLSDRQRNFAKGKYSVTAPASQNSGMGLCGNVALSRNPLCDVVVRCHRALKASEPTAVSV